MFLKNKNIIFKIRRSKVTDYAALNCFLHPNSVYASCTLQNSVTSRDIVMQFYRNFYQLPLVLTAYEDCSNMNASSFITFFTYMLRQNGKRFYTRGL